MILTKSLGKYSAVVVTDQFTVTVRYLKTHQVEYFLEWHKGQIPEDVIEKSSIMFQEASSQESSWTLRPDIRTLKIKLGEESPQIIFNPRTPSLPMSFWVNCGTRLESFISDVGLAESPYLRQQIKKVMK